MLFGRHYPVIYFEKDDDGGDAGNSGDRSDDSSAIVRRALDGLLGKMGDDANKVALHLLEENYRYRGTIRELKAKQPPEGSVIISPTEKELLDKYKALGEPDKIAELQSELENTRRDRLIEQAASITGFKSAVLKRLIADETLEIRRETVDGKQVEVAVVLAGNGKEAVRLEKHAEAAWPDFIPALKADDQEARNSQGDVTGTSFIKQQRGTGGTPDPVADRIKARAEAQKAGKNPLMG